MKYILLTVLCVCAVSSFSQGRTVEGEVKTEILKGSEQQMMSECGAGKTSIEQIVTKLDSKNGNEDKYKIETTLWFRFTDAEGRRCYGSLRYDLLSVNVTKQGLAEMKREKKRQTDLAFDLLYHLQREGNH